MMSNNWYEKGELPPVGTECEVLRNTWVGWEKAKILFIGEQNIVFYPESRIECAWLIEECLFRPIPKKQIVDMDAFNGCGLLMARKNDHRWGLEFPYPEDCTPVLNFQNAVSGLTEEPDYLGPFKYEVKQAHINSGSGTTVEFSLLDQDDAIYWPSVVHITIIGLKGGWSHE